MKTKSLSLLGMSLFALVFLTAFASAVSLAEWNFEGETLTPSVNITSGASLTIVNANGTVSYPAGNAPSPLDALSSTDWNVDDNFEIKVNTIGYENLILKFDEMISSSGPTAFKIQYSSDGTIFTDLPSSTTSTSSAFGANPMHTFDFSAITTIDNNANTKLRIIVTTAGDPVGTWRIDNLKIEATKIVDEPEWVDDFCIFEDGVAENPGDLRVKINDVTVKEGYGDDTEWFPFDVVEFEIEVENKGDDDVDNIEIEWGLYDTSLEEWVIDVDNEKDFDLKDGSDEVTTITFTIDDNMDLDLEDLDDGGHYTLYVRATGEVDNADNDDTCASDSESIEMIIEKDFVVLSDFEVQETVSCGTDLSVSADVWNIGSKDQDEVSVKIFNKELEISKVVEVGDVNSFESEKLDVLIPIPKNAKEKSYVLSFEVYDEGNDIYENDYNEEQSSSTVTIKVEGSCSTSPTGGDAVSAIVSAALESGGKAGEPLLIRSSITNTGNNVATFLLNAAGYAQWASTVTLDKDTFTLNAGASESVLFTFNVKEDVSGDQLFNIEVVSGEQLVTVQPVSVSIEASKGGVYNPFGDNWYLWLIVLLNVILVIIIIIVAVRVARK